MAIRYRGSAVSTIEKQRFINAQLIASSGNIEEAIKTGRLPQYVDTTVSEALIMGLLRQEVTTFVSIFGHGSTEIAEVLRIYEEAGLVKTYPVRNEVEAAHAAMALRWVTGKKAAVITSIGPGALQAMAGSLAASSDGVGVWHIYGDETTEDEGPNMQQIPKSEQNLFLKLCSVMGNAYSLHTPNAIYTALRRGLNTVEHPYKAGPFYLLMPLNTQPAILENFNTHAMPAGIPENNFLPDVDEDTYRILAEKLLAAKKVVVKVGGGARDAGEELEEFLELCDGIAVTSPLVSGIIPYNHPRNMLVSGSKGTICGNFATDEADFLVATGSRFVCQSDSSRTAYPKVKEVININPSLEEVTHYNKTYALWGFCKPVLKKLNETLKILRSEKPGSVSSGDWMELCSSKKTEWEAFKQERYDNPVLMDDLWEREVLTQPAAIKICTDFVRSKNEVSFFDAGDVQANGFQIVEDTKLGQTFTETGASYMGFSVSALLASGLSNGSFYGVAFTGDGSFMMNPQILIDGVEHGVKGCILLFDNRRMAAISGLQKAQYGKEYATRDHVVVDYVVLAGAVKGVNPLFGGYDTESLLSALQEAFSYNGLSLIHIPVYYGDDPLGGLGAFGRWNVGNWVESTQKRRHLIGL